MKLYTEDGEAYPAIVALPDADPAPSGFTELTDIVEVAKHGEGTLSESAPGWTDRLTLREKLKGLIYDKMGVVVPADVDDQTKWDELTAAEKSIAAHYFIVGAEAFFMEVVNGSRYWVIKAGAYRCWTQEARTERAELCEAIIFLRMQNVGDAKLILSDLNQIAKDSVIDVDDVTKKAKKKIKVKRLNRMYIEGLEDEEHDGVVAIKDWINSQSGTPFATDGFMDLTYPFKTGHTAASVAAELLAILDGTF